MFVVIAFFETVLYITQRDFSLQTPLNLLYFESCTKISYSHGFTYSGSKNTICLESTKRKHIHITFVRVFVKLFYDCVQLTNLYYILYYLITNLYYTYMYVEKHSIHIHNIEYYPWFQALQGHGTHSLHIGGSLVFGGGRENWLTEGKLTYNCNKWRRDQMEIDTKSQSQYRVKNSPFSTK